MIFVVLFYFYLSSSWEVEGQAVVSGDLAQQGCEKLLLLFLLLLLLLFGFILLGSVRLLRKMARFNLLLKWRISKMRR